MYFFSCSIIFPPFENRKSNITNQKKIENQI
jgi:hypothetical protein